MRLCLRRKKTKPIRRIIQNIVRGIIRNVKKVSISSIELSEEGIFQSTDSIYILVLGGGHSENINLPPIDQLSSNSLGRLSEGIRLHKNLPGSYLVFSGMVEGQKFSHAEILKQAALSMGVEEKVISLLPRSVNTKMEALDFTNKFGINSNLILVTDAIHMPRAMLRFNKVGQFPTPAPTNHMVKSEIKPGIRDWGPSSINISRMEYALHEIVGIVYAKLF